MKQLKRIAAIALAATAFAMIAGAGSASATTIEVEGITQNKSSNVEFRVALGTKAVLARTDGSFANECSISRMRGNTQSPYTGTTVTAWVGIMYFETCVRPVIVHIAGTLHVEHIAGTTDGTVSSSGAEITVGSPFGTLNCQTGSGVDIGRLTGTSSGWAKMDVNAVLNCGFLVPSATWKGTYEETWANGTGVSA